MKRLRIRICDQMNPSSAPPVKPATIAPLGICSGDHVSVVMGTGRGGMEGPVSGALVIDWWPDWLHGMSHLLDCTRRLQMQPTHWALSARMQTLSERNVSASKNCSYLLVNRYYSWAIFLCKIRIEPNSINCRNNKVIVIGVSAPVLIFFVFIYFKHSYIYIRHRAGTLTGIKDPG